MRTTIRPAMLSDLERVSELLLADAKARCALDPQLWKLDSAAREKILSTVRLAMEAEKPAFRQQWLVADTGGDIVGVTHSILLPVPPIYAGELGPPGLIMEDCFIKPDAPPETRAALLRSAEADLVNAGARILLASSVEDGDWEGEYLRQGFKPLTLYFAKTGLNEARDFTDVRQAIEEDVPNIVTSSAVNRQILKSLHPFFWKPHDDADNRFGSWMKRSLTLSDRDMFVSDSGGRLRGYAISHPATPLHFPSPHDISAVGVIDDYFHEELEQSQGFDAGSTTAAALLAAAEAARKIRGDASVIVVCPAAWHTKIALLEQSGYRKAITWFIKMGE